MALDFSNITPNSIGPATNVYAVTESDSVADANGPFKCLYIGTTGDVKATTVAGQTVVFVAVPAGTTLPFAVSRVWTTGTTASNILGGW